MIKRSLIVFLSLLLLSSPAAGQEPPQHPCGDGYNFTPVTWVEFYDEAGNRIEGFGDADVLMTTDGHFYLYGSGKGSQGLGVFIRSG